MLLSNETKLQNVHGSVIVFNVEAVDQNGFFVQKMGELIRCNDRWRMLNRYIMIERNVEGNLCRKPFVFYFVLRTAVAALSTNSLSPCFEILCRYGAVLAFVRNVVVELQWLH